MSSIHSLITEHILHSDAVKTFPPIVVSGMTLFGYQISDIGIIITIFYTLLMIFVTLRDRVFNNKKQTTNGEHN